MCVPLNKTRLFTDIYVVTFSGDIYIYKKYIMKFLIVSKRGEYIFRSDLGSTILMLICRYICQQYNFSDFITYLCTHKYNYYTNTTKWFLSEDMLSIISCHLPVSYVSTMERSVSRAAGLLFRMNHLHSWIFCELKACYKNIRMGNVWIVFRWHWPK